MLERNGLPTAVLDSREAAAYLAIGVQSLYYLVRRGEIPHTRVGKAIRFQQAELDRYLAARTSTDWRPGGGRSEAGQGG